MHGIMVPHISGLELVTLVYPNSKYSTNYPEDNGTDSISMCNQQPFDRHFGRVYAKLLEILGG